MIFSYGDKWYQVSYSQGATEYQDERPFQYEDDEIECEEVKQVKRTVVLWVPVHPKAAKAAAKVSEEEQEEMEP